MNDMSDNERVIDSSVTWRMERDATEGIRKNSTANAMIPWKIRSRKMPFNVIEIIGKIICASVM